MPEYYFQKQIGNRAVYYDMNHGIIKFSVDEQISDNYSPERLALVAQYKTDIVITRNCNQECINCFVNSSPSNVGKEMSYADLESSIREIAGSRIRILITGGEPFMHSEIDRILGLPEKFGNLRFVICSNGTLIKESMIDLLTEFNWMTILSIHGEPATHDKYTRSPGSYSKVVQALEKLSSRRARLKIYSVINEYSRPEDIDRIFKLRDGHRVGFVKFMPPRNAERYCSYYSEDIVDYVRSRLDCRSGLQIMGSDTPLITITGDTDTTN